MQRLCQDCLEPQRLKIPPLPIVEEEMGRTMTDPYQAAAEGVTTDDTTHAENVPTSDGASSAQSHVTPPAVVGEPMATSSIAVTVLVAEIPLPELTMRTTKEVDQAHRNLNHLPKKHRRHHLRNQQIHWRYNHHQMWRRTHLLSQRRRASQ